MTSYKQTPEYLAFKAKLAAMPLDERLAYLAAQRSAAAGAAYVFQRPVVSAFEFLQMESGDQSAIGILYLRDLGLTVGMDIHQDGREQKYRVVAVVASPHDAFSRRRGREIVERVLSAPSLADALNTSGKKVPGKFDFFHASLPLLTRNTLRISRFIDRLRRLQATLNTNYLKALEAVDCMPFNLRECEYQEYGRLIKRARPKIAQEQVLAFLNWDFDSVEKPRVIEDLATRPQRY